jgi:ComF family protein
LNKYITPLVNTSVREICGDFVSLFFPRYCAGCEDALVKGEEFICSKCILEIPRTNHHLEQENAFYQKLRARIDVKYVMSFFAFTKSGRVQNILHTLKYRNQPAIGQMLGRVYAGDLVRAGYAKEFDAVIPIPLHAAKKRKRGYNQSEQFAIGLAEELKINCSDEWLKRNYQTQTQTRKSRLKRWENVKEVFSAIRTEELCGKRILLVDDVVTTGATLEAAARVVIKAGCKEISIACIAATQ